MQRRQAIARASIDRSLAGRIRPRSYVRLFPALFPMFPKCQSELGTENEMGWREKRYIIHSVR